MLLAMRSRTASVLTGKPESAATKPASRRSIDSVSVPWRTVRPVISFALSISPGSTRSPRRSEATLAALVRSTTAVAPTLTAASTARMVSCRVFMMRSPVLDLTGSGRRGRRNASPSTMMATVTGTTPTLSAVIQLLRPSTSRRSANCTSRSCARMPSSWARKPSIAFI